MCHIRPIESSLLGSCLQFSVTFQLFCDLCLLCDPPLTHLYFSSQHSVINCFFIMCRTWVQVSPRPAVYINPSLPHVVCQFSMFCVPVNLQKNTAIDMDQEAELIDPCLCRLVVSLFWRLCTNVPSLWMDRLAEFLWHLWGHQLISWQCPPMYHFV